MRDLLSAENIKEIELNFSLKESANFAYLSLMYPTLFISGVFQI
jgi:hypothetical protein